MSAGEIASALGGHRSGPGFLCHCPVPSHGRGKGDKRPSLFIRDGDTRLLVTCFAGCDRRAVLDELGHRGLLAERIADARAVLTRRARPPEPEPAPNPKALGLWRAARPLECTLGEQYLRRHRGLRGPFPPSLRFLQWAGGVALPAIVAAVSRPDRKIIAVQCSYLQPSDGAKARVPEPRMTTGRLGTGAVRLASAGEVLGIAEGLETALAAMELSGVPCWASLGAQRLDKITVPSVVREIVIFADADETGRPCAARASSRYAREGKRVELRFPPDGCKDWNDALLSQRRAA